MLLHTCIAESVNATRLTESAVCVNVCVCVRIFAFVSSLTHL